MRQQWGEIYGIGGADAIDGSAGNGTLYGGDEIDTLFGGDGDDFFEGGVSADSIYGGSGNDTIAATDGEYLGDVDGGGDVDLLDLRADLTYGFTVDLASAARDDSGFAVGSAALDFENVLGTQTSDTILGDVASNWLGGQGGADLLDGGTGNDSLEGDAGQDTLLGGTDDDRLFGGTGNDTLRGEAGGDVLYGGAGFDRIDGGQGDNSLYGNSNADTFVFADGHGVDTVFDFAATNPFEKIDLSAISAFAAVTDYAGLFATGAVTAVGPDVQIETGGGNSIVLQGVALGQLDDTDFLF